MLSGSLTLPKLAGMAPYWRVSIAALLQRACDVKRVAQRAQRALWSQLASAGYKTQEPPELDFPVEDPTLLRTILETHIRDLGFSHSDVAKVVVLFEDEMLDVYRLRPRGLRAVSG
jgi:Zn-dependent peptidase ImmA (M78 family)